MNPDQVGRERPGQGQEAAAAEAGEAEASQAGEPDELAKVIAERDEYFKALRQLQADFENYRKRVTRQNSELSERAAEGLVTKLLPVLEAVDLAADHGESEEATKIRSLLLDVLGKEGLERIDPQGDPFDPTRHDAVMHEPGDQGEGHQVAESMRAGYAWNGRVLRPAMVKVRG